MFESPFAPYLTPSPSLIRADPWMIEVGETETRPLESFINSWTQGTDIFLSRTIEIDRKELLQETLLPETTELAISVTWVSKSTKLKRRVYRAPISREPVHVRVRLSGDEVGSTITIVTSLILNARNSATSPWVAQRPGSILLRDRKIVALEGDGASFPMAVINFDSTVYPDFASWYLTSTTDLEASFTSTFQVMINEKDKQLVRAIEARNPSREQSVILEDLVNGVVATILELAYSLQNGGFLQGPGYEHGSVGAVLSGFIEDTNHLELDINADPSRVAYRRAFFESLARSIGAGRSLS